MESTNFVWCICFLCPNDISIISTICITFISIAFKMLLSLSLWSFFVVVYFDYPEKSHSTRQYICTQNTVPFRCDTSKNSQIMQMYWISNGQQKLSCHFEHTSPRPREKQLEKLNERVSILNVLFRVCNC